MRSSSSVLLAAAALPALASATPLSLLKRAQLALDFVAPSSSPLNQSSTYVGAANGTLAKRDVVPGKAFDRLVHIWLENTDIDIAMATGAFQSLAKQGITHSNRYAVTHPSEPNYLASVAGDFFGMADDSFYYLPNNVTTLFDLLDDGGAGGKPISYACYQENMPTNGYTGFNYTDKNYLTNQGNYVYYVRKHNPCAITNYVSGDETRRVNANRNLNQFAADLAADALPQWMFITPNLVNDGHDTRPNFFSNWTEYFLNPLLNDTRFNNNRTLVVLTFDENETYGDPNKIALILLGGGLPASSHGTVDDTYYTHYSDLSSVQRNWGLKNLGRGDKNATLSNVYSTFAEQLGYTNNNDSTNAVWNRLNETGVAPGPFSLTMHADFPYPPNADNETLIRATLANSTTTAASGTTNLTAAGQKNPYSTNPYGNSPGEAVASNPSSTGGGGSANSAAGARTGSPAAALAALALALAAGLATLA